MISDLMDIEKNRIRGGVMYAELKSRELLADIERYGTLFDFLSLDSIYFLPIFSGFVVRLIGNVYRLLIADIIKSIFCRQS